MGIIKDDKPILPISIGSHSGIQELPVLLDTGFTGELKLSPRIAAALGITTDDVMDVFMGDGSGSSHGIGRAIVSLEGIRKEVDALVGNGPTLIGVRLMREFGYTLTVDFPRNEFVLQKEVELFEE